MITSTGVGVGGVGGIGMLRARRRDVSVKPNRKLDRKSSRGMIYENEELRLRTIQINAEVEQGQNDIKKLRRENEQLRREIWCLREEYDKLEDILKNKKTRGDSEDSENCSDDEEAEDDDDNCNENGLSSGSEDRNNEDVKREKENIKEDEENIKKKYLLFPNDELVKDERFENAENQKLVGEKVSRVYVPFDQLSIVDEEEESLKKEKIFEEVPETKSNIQTDTGYVVEHAFNWIINPKCSSISSSKEQSLYYKSTGDQSSPRLSWERGILEKDTDRHETWAESIVSNQTSCRLSRNDKSGDFSIVSEINNPSSSSENTSSTIIQKTSPDIFVSGAVTTHKNFGGSSDPLLIDSNKESMSKSYSCQELGKFLNSSITQGIAAKSLPNNSTPRAFRSQLMVQLSKLPVETQLEMPPEMSTLNLTPGKSYYGTTESLIRKLSVDEYQVTSFESPIPRHLTLPSSSYSLLTRCEKKLPTWSSTLSTLQIDTQTQTCQSTSNSQSPSTSSLEQEDKKNCKSLKIKKNKSKNKVTLSMKSENVKLGDEDKSERQSSSSGIENHQKLLQNSRYKSRGLSLYSQSIGQVPDNLDIPSEEKIKRNSINSDSVPWCACWGNGCV